MYYHLFHHSSNWIDHSLREIGRICLRWELSSRSVIEYECPELLFKSTKTNQLLLKSEVIVLEGHLDNFRLLLKRQVVSR